MKPDKERPSTRLVGIDVLRGLAALTVMIGHLAASPTLTPAAGSWMEKLLYPLRFSYTGVNLFLVLSGFCIHLSFSGRRVTFTQFWKRRFFRLYPPYFAVIVISILVGLLGSVSFRGGFHVQLPPAPYHNWGEFRFDVLTHVFLIQSFWSQTLEGLYNPPFWSLALEEQLYMLYWVLLLLLSRLSPLRCLLVAFALSFAWSFGADTLVWRRLAPARWFEWCLGAMAAEAFLGKLKLPNWCSDLRLSALLLLLATRPGLHQFSDMLFGCGYFMMLHAFVSQEKRGNWTFDSRLWRLLAWVGLWSYSLYLMHVPLLRLSFGVLAFLGLSQGWLAQLLVMVSSALVGSWLFFMAVERHFLRPKF